MFKRISAIGLAALMLISMLACFVLPASATTDWITVCSYNVKVLYYDHVNNKNGTPMSKFDAVCEELRKIDADLVGLQELDRFSTRCGTGVDQLQMLAQELGYPYSYYTKTIPSSGTNSEYGHGVLSRYPITQSNSYFFADYSGNIDGTEPRGFSRHELNVGGKVLVFYNTHLANHSPEQIQIIAGMMNTDQKAGKGAVLTGDMNEYPKNLETAVTSNNCTQLNTVAKPQQTVYTTDYAAIQAGATPIDNIVVTNNLGYYWDNTNQTGIMVNFSSASDHLPIYTQISIDNVTAKAPRDPAETHYFVRNASQWNTYAKESSTWENKVIHLEADIDFAGVAVSQFETFNGTIDGHGHIMKNISMTTSDLNGTGAGLVKNLGGTIQNLNLDSSCTFKSTAAYGRIGAYAVATQNATIYNCTTAATVTAGKGDHVGGFVGTGNHGITLDSCLFKGTVSSTASGYQASALVGYSTDTPIRIINCIAAGTVTAGSVGLVRVHSTVASAVNKPILINTYATGNLPAFHYNGTPNATDAAARETAHKIADPMEAAWVVNKNHEQTNRAQVWYSADCNGVLALGKKEDRVIKMTVENGDSKTVSYHGPRMLNGAVLTTQTQIAPEAISGKTAEVFGAEYTDGIIYVGHQDITVRYTDAATYEFCKAKDQLQKLVDAYKAMDHQYFTDWAVKDRWLAQAEKALSNPKVETSKLNQQIRLESFMNEGVRAMEYPNYPSLKDYPIYQSISGIKDYAVRTAEDWLAAVEMSNFVDNPNAVDFSGITIHLTNDIDLEGAQLLPLCYGGVLDADIDGHGYSFENVNINIHAPYGPVGLVAQLGKTAAKKITNLSIGSGKINITGMPRYKLAWGINDAGCKTAAICGKGHKSGCLFRKCSNAADINVQLADNTAGIIADSRNSVIVDSCFNLGQSRGELAGYGGTAAKIYNSINDAAAGAATTFNSGIASSGDPEAKIRERVCNVYGVLSNILSLSSTLTDAQKAARDAVNEAAKCKSYGEAAWRANQGYQKQNLGSGERIYFTLDEDGQLAFGKPDGSDQVRRITMKFGDETVYMYAAAGSTIQLECPDPDEFYLYNYFAVTQGKNSKIQGKQLTLGNEDITVVAEKNIHRGDVDGSGSITLFDLVALARYVVGSSSTINVKAADVNSNGIVEMRDAQLIVKEWLLKQPGTWFDWRLPTATRDDYIKVCSYNIKSFHYDPYSGNAYENGEYMGRYNSVLSELKEIKADIIGFQEVDINNKESKYEHQLQKLSNDLKSTVGYTYHYQFFSTVPDSTGSYGHGIMSKYPILASGETRFAGIPQENGIRLDGQEPRGYGWYQLDINGNGTYDKGSDILFYNCHLAEYTAQQLKYMSVDLENDINAGHKVVVTGDFNLQAYEMPGCFDTDKLTAMNGGDSFSSYELTTERNGNVIDNILVSSNVEHYWNEGMGIGFFTSDTPYNDLSGGSATASDHLALWTYIKKE